MPILSKDGKHLLFVHVPKTAGMSMLRLFLDDGWSLDYFDRGVTGETLNHLRPCSPQHMHAALLTSVWKTELFDGIFMVVRNPYDRFRSEFVMDNSQEFTLSESAVARWAKKCFDGYEAAPYINDNHLRPQNEFCLPGSLVMRFEEGFKFNVNKLNGYFSLGLPPKSPREMVPEVDGTPTFDSKQVPIGKKVSQMIEAFYAEDFRLFSYPMIGSATEG